MCMYTHIRICVYIYICVCVYVYIHTYAHPHIHIYIQICINVRAGGGASLYSTAHIYYCIYIYIYIYPSISIYLSIYLSIYISTCMYPYTRMHRAGDCAPRKCAGPKRRWRPASHSKAHRLCVSLNSRLESNKEEEEKAAHRGNALGQKGVGDQLRQLGRPHVGALHPLSHASTHKPVYTHMDA